MQKDKFQFKTSVKNSAIKNIKLNQDLAKAQQILNDFIRFDRTSTFTEFVLKFKSNYNSNDFYNFVLNYINTNKNLSKEAVRTYKPKIADNS